MNSVAAATLLAALLVSVFTCARLARHDWDPTSFIVAGDAWVDAAATPDRLQLAADPGGYDGQYVYRLAIEPFTREQTDHGVLLDLPAYRQQRIGLPLLAWLVDHATPLSLPVALIVVNALAVVVGAWVGAKLSLALGRHALWGVLVALAPAIVIAYARDLTEPLATLFLLAGLLAWIRERRMLAAGVFVLAALTRETSLAIVGGMAAWHLVMAGRGGPARRGRFVDACWLAVPLVVALAWQGWLYNVWHKVAVLDNGGNVGLPFVEVVRTLFLDSDRLFDFSVDGVVAQVLLMSRLLLAAFFGYVAWNLRGSRLPADIRTGWVVAALVALSVAGWTRDEQFLRAANEAITVGLLVVLAMPSRASRWVLTTGAGYSAVMAAKYAFAS